MKRFCILSLLIALPACSGDDSAPNNGNPPTDGSVADNWSPDSGVADVGVSQDADSSADAAKTDQDAVVADAAPDASGDGACPTAWLETPEVDPSIAVPDGGGGLLLHALGNGTQNYVCASTPDAGTGYGWVLVAPDATLSDCHAAVIGHHFASEAGAGFPEWQTNDGYVVGQKHLPTFVPDGGVGSIPWLLLREVDAGGTGPLSNTLFVQRLNTDGGVAPAGTCNAGSVGTTVNIPYVADYFFFGP